MRLPETKFVVAGALIVAGIGYLMFSGIGSSMVYYFSLDELAAQAHQLEGRGVRISGRVLPGSIQQEPEGRGVRFVMYERDSGRQLEVRYGGLVPDTFKDDAEVVVEGTYRFDAPVFEAATLLAKCPSKYEGQAERHPEDISLN
jgi:cytochrome c-type biogenesis protein CcmE